MLKYHSYVKTLADLIEISWEKSEKKKKKK